jgi:apolipoprotein D and lipocalin family protein
MFKALLIVMFGLLTAACQSSRPPVMLADDVDLERFMGDWYVIAGIPTPFERNAYAALEQYELTDAGQVATTFSYRPGGFDAERKVMTATGFVRPGTGNAVWGMQFIWPFRADYRVMYVADDYSSTVIGRNARDYLWIMARTPTLPEAELAALLEFSAQQGYDLNAVRKVPQEPLDSEP